MTPWRNEKFTPVTSFPNMKLPMRVESVAKASTRMSSISLTRSVRSPPRPFRPASGAWFARVPTSSIIARFDSRSEDWPRCASFSSFSIRVSTERIESRNSSSLRWSVAPTFARSAFESPSTVSRTLLSSEKAGAVFPDGLKRRLKACFGLISRGVGWVAELQEM